MALLCRSRAFKTMHVLANLAVYMISLKTRLDWPVVWLEMQSIPFPNGIPFLTKHATGYNVCHIMQTFTVFLWPFPLSPWPFWMSFSYVDRFELFSKAMAFDIVFYCVIAETLCSQTQLFCPFTVSLCLCLPSVWNATTTPVQPLYCQQGEEDPSGPGLWVWQTQGESRECSHSTSVVM